TPAVDLHWPPGAPRERPMDADRERPNGAPWTPVVDAPVPAPAPASPSVPVGVWHRAVEPAVALEETLLAVVRGHLPPPDDDVLDRGRQFERIAGPDDDVGLLADLDRAVAVVHPPDAGRV